MEVALSRGPIPQRSTERTRRNKTGEDGLEIKKGVALPYEWVEPNPEWPEFLTDYFESFKESGMQAYFQQTDVAQLYMACEILSQQFNTGRPSAMMVAEAFKLLDGLGATEGERRRIKIELEEPGAGEVEEDAKVTHLADARARLKKA